ncbi:MAG: IclR family transcriptional regulator [Peptococcaceae bacterium]|nr:IclR family transcriptional regulator [Peptococcaceae bacterium]
MVKKNFSEYINSVEKAFTVLDALCRADEAGITELSRELGMGKTTVFRLVATLEMLGLVRQLPSGKYAPTLKIFEMGSRVVSRLGVRKPAAPFLEELYYACNETVNLAVLDKGEVIYLDRWESKEPLRIGLDVGVRVPAYCSGLGKAILAHLESADRKRALSFADFRRYTENTITDPELLARELEIVRSQGYAVDNGEYIEGIVCLGAPVFGHEGRVVAAVSIAAPSVRLNKKQMLDLIPRLKDTAAKISARLGYQAY